MSAKATLAMMLSIPTEQVVATVAAAILLPVLIVWLVMRSKLKRLQRESTATLEQLRAESGAALQAEQAQAAAKLAEARQSADATTAKLTDLEQRFSTHREVADRRANDASRQISQLEAELASTRELAAQLVPTQSRIKDLETALAAEQGRVKAQEQAIEATNARAADFEKRMIDAKDLLLKHKAEMQETAVELKKVRDEQAAYAAAGGPEAELAKAKEATQQAEVKIANLQRALKAAEARTEMVQKEFMNAVGVATVPTPGASAAANDKKLREQEEKLAHLEAESRKRAREDGYKIAELEYRLSEALEAAKAAQAKPEPVAVAEAPQVAAPVAAPPPAEPAAVVPTPMNEAPKMEAVAAEEAKEDTPVADTPVVETPVAEIPIPAAPEAGIPMPEAAAAISDTPEVSSPAATETPA